MMIKIEDLNLENNNQENDGLKISEGSLINAKIEIASCDSFQ